MLKYNHMNFRPAKIILACCFMILLFFCFSLAVARAQAAVSTTVEAVDSDHDGLSDDAEINIYHADPNLWDTDGDGYGDGDEVWNGYDPTKPGTARLGAIDSDGDWLVDEVEKKLGTDPVNADTDGDGYSDGVEVVNGYNPVIAGAARETDKRAEIDLTNQRLDYYFKGIKIGTILVSTGRAPLLTPTGNFSILRKRPVVNYAGATYSYPNTKWNLEFKNGFYIHGAYWHNQFGKKSMSHGCVNVAYKDMKTFYNFMDIGSPVKIFGKTPAGVISVND
jgi:lipoprotein-anchoring transpeptidase ErfK/SrfK